MSEPFEEARLLAEVAALEPLPEEPDRQLEHLRLIAVAEGVIMDQCPECGTSLEGIDIRAHASSHWPPYVERRHMSPEAKQRQGAMLRAADKQRLPKPEPEEE